jgi:hypothetical protein
MEPRIETRDVYRPLPKALKASLAPFLPSTYQFQAGSSKPSLADLLQLNGTAYSGRLSGKFLTFEGTQSFSKAGAPVLTSGRKRNVGDEDAKAKARDVATTRARASERGLRGMRKAKKAVEQTGPGAVVGAGMHIE